MALVLDGSGDITGLTGGAIESSAIGTGAVLQVVNAAIDTDYSTSSSSFTYSGLSASITPKFSSSKILVLARIPIGFSSSSNNVGGGIALYRDSTALYTPTTYEHYLNLNTIAPRWVDTVMYLDTPATTSSVTYKFYFSSYQGNGTFSIGETGPSVINLLEIAG